MLVGIPRHFAQREKSPDSSHSFGVTVLQGGIGRSVPAKSGIVHAIADKRESGRIQKKETVEEHPRTPMSIGVRERPVGWMREKSCQAAGSMTLNTVPSPSRVCTSIVPPMDSTRP